jgi:hypothetical protein
MRYAELDDTAETIYGAFKEEAVGLTRTSGRTGARSPIILELASRLWVDGFHGVGPVTTLKMNPLGIETGLVMCKYMI